MRSASGDNWVTIRLIPPDLKRLSFLSVYLLFWIVACLVAVGIGINLAWKQHLNPPPIPDIAPYMGILIATFIGIVLISVVFKVAEPAINVRIPGSEDFSELAPAHRQIWVYQENRYKGYLSTLAAVLWHGVGLLALGHYLFVAWPQIAPAILPFGAYLLIGLIPLRLAKKGWRQRQKGGGTVRPARSFG